MATINENLYRQEIEELTDFVRNDNSWSYLRSILIEKDFNLSDTFLVSFYEDEEEMEYGVIVTRDKKVFKYSRSTAEGENNIENFSIDEITNNVEKINEYPQIYISFMMLDEGVQKGTDLGIWTLNICGQGG